MVSTSAVYTTTLVNVPRASPNPSSYVHTSYHNLNYLKSNRKTDSLILYCIQRNIVTKT